MGAAATTAKQPLTEVDIKNEIGVLYGKEAQQAFAAAKEDDVVAWPKVPAYAEAHGVWILLQVGSRGVLIFVAWPALWFAPDPSRIPGRTVAGVGSPVTQVFHEKTRWAPKRPTGHRKDPLGTK